jgi:hypothetical protein
MDLAGGGSSPPLPLIPYSPIEPLLNFHPRLRGRGSYGDFEPCVVDLVQIEAKPEAHEHCGVGFALLSEALFKGPTSDSRRG